MVQRKQVQLAMASLWTFFSSLAAKKKKKVIASPSVCVVKCPTHFRESLNFGSLKITREKLCVFGIFLVFGFFCHMSML